MLAKRRKLMLGGEEIERTPLLIPSFSSKGFPDIKKILEYCSELIDGVMLISAYDVYHKNIIPPFNFPSLIFLDSGGYEVSKDIDLSDFERKKGPTPETWTDGMHAEVLSKWNTNIPSVVISYDHQLTRYKISEQIENASALFSRRKGVIREILLKPETKTQKLLQMPEVLANIRKLADFDIIGVTEKEIGSSIIERMKNIALLRNALTKTGLDTPIHIFGSLDTITTPLYFLAGADIFDGLTWLRFAYHEGWTLYKQNYGAFKFGILTKSAVTDGRCINDNYYYLKNLQQEMRNYLNGYDIASFKHHRDLFQDALASTTEAIGG